MINYVGWVGHQNIGDEALYRVIQNLFHSYRFIYYQGTAHSQVTFFGGGTLLPLLCTSVEPNVRPTKFNYVFGTGVLDPVFYGRWHPVAVERLKSFNFRFIGVRDIFSKNILNEWGIKSEVIGDPCLSLEPCPNKRRYDKRVAVNIGSDGLVWGGNEEIVFQEITKVCHTLKTHGYQPVIIPFNKEDFGRIKESPLNNFEIFREWFDVNSVLDFISSCKILIGERLHSTIFSSCTFTPFISINYRPKCLHFAETMGFEKYAVRTDELTSKKIMDLFFDVMNNWCELNNSLEKAVTFYRKKQATFVERITSDIETLPDYKWVPPNMSHVKNVFWNVDSLLNVHSSKLWPIWSKCIFLRLLKFLT